MAKSGQYSRSVLEGSDSYSDEVSDIIYCEPCHQAGHVVKAEGYCVDCPEYLCGQCYKSHRLNKILAKHVLLDKDSMPVAPDTSRRVLDVCEENCPNHPSKVIEFFCGTCENLGCHVCVTLNHRQCEAVKHIPDIAKDLEQTEEFKRFNEDIKSTSDSLSVHENKLQAHATTNDDMRKLAKLELARQRAEVNKYFDHLEKKMDDQITAIEKGNKDTLRAASDKLDEIKKDFDQIKHVIDAKKTGKNCELFIAMKRGKEKIAAFSNQFNKMRKELQIQHYTLLPSEQIEAMMRTTTEICTPATARLESEINTKTSADKKVPCIYGLTIMHGHYCVVVDNANKSVKVIDTQSKHVTSQIGIEADCIWSVTSVSDDQVAVSVSLSGGREQMQIFTVSASGLIQRTNQVYDVDTWYTNIVHCKGNIYGVGKNGIDVLNMSGKIIRTIQPADNCEGLFDDLAGIALSPDGQTLYVTGQKKHSVTSMTLDGKVKATYKDKDLWSPRGITVDKHGYVYVSSSGSHTIHQVTTDFNKVQVLIDDVDVTEITYSSTEHKLYINESDGIYQFSLDKIN